MKKYTLTNLVLLASLTLLSACSSPTGPKVKKETPSIQSIMGIEGARMATTSPVVVESVATPTYHASSTQVLTSTHEVASPQVTHSVYEVAPPQEVVSSYEVSPTPVVSSTYEEEVIPPQEEVSVAYSSMAEPVYEEEDTSSYLVASYVEEPPSYRSEPLLEPLSEPFSEPLLEPVITLPDIIEEEEPMVERVYASAPVVAPPSDIEVVSTPTRPPRYSFPATSNIEVVSYASRQPVIDRLYQRNSAMIANEIETKAKQLLGIKYVWGATGPNTYDCSGFTQKIFRDAGINIPRVSRDQAKVGKYVRYASLRKGDMVFFDTQKHPTGKVTHVGIYLGNGNFIHASSGAKKVVIYNFNKKTFYKKRFLWGRRVINDTHLASL